jgi:DNA-binding MarR family transcriptional regulator
MSERERPLAASSSSSFPGADEIPYRSDILAALGAIKTIWAMPEYTLDIAHLAMPELDLGESNVLWALGYRGPLRPMDLADMFAMHRSNVSKVLNRLEGRGLVERRAETTDGRSVRIHLSEAGERASRRLYAAGDMQMTELLRGWSEQEIQDFAAYAARFADSAKDLAERLRRGEISNLPDDVD